MPAPTKFPDWATDGTNTVEPPAGKVAAGWVPAEQPPAGWFNWWQNIVGQWTRWFDTQVTSLTGRVGTLETEMDAVEAINGSQGTALAGLADAAHTLQPNTFTQPQTITANVPGTDALTVTGHIITTVGSIGAYGANASVHAEGNVDGYDVDARHNMHVDTDLYVDKGEFKYKTPANKPRTTFVPIFSGSGGAVHNGADGEQLGGHAGYNLKFLVANAKHVFPIRLPHGAVLTAFAALVWKAGTGTVSVELIRRTNHNFEEAGAPPTRTLDQTSLVKPILGAFTGPKSIGATCNVTFDNRAEDAANGSEYLLSVTAGDANDEIHAIRLVWTDPGPRNF